MAYGPDRNSNRRAVQSRPRSSPYNQRGRRMDGNGMDMEVDTESNKNFIKVSGQSNVKAVAGKIAHSCRAGDPPAALCIGPTCINQAVKAICVARGYLSEDGWDLSLQPAFRDTDRSRASLALYLAKQRGAYVTTGEEQELAVGGHSKPPTVAGALAARVRERKAVCLTAIGVDAVANAVLAIGNCRLYLENDHLDIRAQPEFVQVQKDGRELNAVRFVITVEDI